MNDFPSNLGTGWQSVPKALVKQVWGVHTVSAFFYFHIHEGLLKQVSWSSFASVQVLNVLQVLELGVNAQATAVVSS